MYQESFSSSFKRGYLSIPTSIRVIITINVAVYIIQALGGSTFNSLLIEYFAFDPTWQTAFLQPWRLVTYLFIHGSGFHLLFNMLWLWWMGKAVEMNLGPRTFSVIFFGSGIGGALLNVALALLIGGNYVIGASGAVFGVMVAFAFMFPHMPIMLFLLPPIEARFVVAGLIAFDLLFVGTSDGIARAVHLGGAGVGYLLIKSHYDGTDLGSWMRSAESFFKPSGKKKRKRNKNMYSVSDVDIVEEKKRDNNSDELDSILEKISKGGYDALSAEEKKKLFELSKRNE